MIATSSGLSRHVPDALLPGPRTLLCLFLLVLLGLSAHAQGITYSGSAIDAGSGLVGQTINAGSIRLDVPAGATTITGVTFTSDGAVNQEFAANSNTCTGTLTGPGSCTISLNFTPNQTGLRRGAITISSSGNAPLVIYLRGIGQGSQLVFSPDAASAISTVTPLSPIYYSPTTSVYDGAGNLFFNDVLNNRILEQSASGTLSTVFSLPGNIMSAIAISPTGTLFVSVPSQSAVYAVNPGGTAAPIAFSGVTLSQPTGLAVDGSGNLYIADAQSNRIVRSAFNGSGATVLPLTGLATPLSGPEGLAVDANGNLFIVDTGRQRLVKVVLATGAASPFAITGSFIFNSYGVTTDASGSLYLADTGNRRILRVSPTGAASVVLTPGFAFSTPTGVALAANGDIIVADNNVGLTRITRATPSSPLTFNTATPVGSLDSADGSKVVTLQNIGNAALGFVIPSGAATNPSSTSAAFQLASSGSTCPVLTSASTTAGSLAPGASCDYAVTFTPTVVGVNTGSLAITERNFGAATTVSQTFPLTGTGLTNLDALNIFTGTASTLTGTPITFTVSALAGGALSAGYRGTVTLTSTDPAASFLSGTTYTFTAADAGVHVFTAPASGIRFATAGTFTLSAKDGAVTANSNVVVVKTSQAASTTTLAVTPSPVFLFSAATLTATVSSALTTVPTGTVTFFDGGVAIGSASLSAGKAILTPTFSTTGAHALTAIYNADANFLASTSGATTIQVIDFTIAAAVAGASSASVLPGKAAAYSFVVTPVGATTFPAAVTFTVSGLPAGATYTIAPASIAAGATASTHTLTINVPQVARLNPAPAHPFLRDTERLGPIAFALLLPLLSRRTRRCGARIASLLLLLLTFSATLALTGCLSDQASGYFGQAPTTYTLTLTATSGGLSHSTNFTLTVQ